MVYINNNYRRQLNIELIAAEVYISPDYLAHMFIDLVGMTFTEYLNNLRIASACEKLKRNKTVDIGQVALSVGYSDSKYFARVFKKIKGVTAREYRKNSEEKDPFAWMKEKNIDF